MSVSANQSSAQAFTWKVRIGKDDLVPMPHRKHSTFQRSAPGAYPLHLLFDNNGGFSLPDGGFDF